MTEIKDIVSIDTIKELYPEAVAALELAHEYQTSRTGDDRPVKGGEWRIPVRAENSDEIGVPLLKFVHTIMWTEGTSIDNKRFPRLWHGKMADLLRTHFDMGMTDYQRLTLGGQIAQMLKRNKLIRHDGQGVGRPWFVAPWHEPSISTDRKTSKLSHADKVTIEKRIVEEADKPVRVHFELSQIPLPEPNAEAMVAYVRKVADFAKRVTVAYENQAALTEQLQARVDQLEKELAEKDEYKDAVSRLAEIVGG